MAVASTSIRYSGCASAWTPIHDEAGGLRRAVWAATTDHPGAAATAMVHALQEEAGS